MLTWKNNEIAAGFHNCPVISDIIYNLIYCHKIFIHNENAQQTQTNELGGKKHNK